MQAQLAIERFQRRVRHSVAIAAFVDGVAATALTGAAALLIGRLFGVWPQPATAWLVALAIPLAWTAWRMRRLQFSKTASAAHLDRRLALDGLLVAGLERDTTQWNERLAKALHGARERFPQPRPGQLLLRAGGSSLILFAVTLLPAPQAPTLVRHRVLEQALADLDEDLELLEQTGAIEEERREELRERLAAMRDGLQQGEHIEWSDVDALQGELAHAQTLQAATLEETRAALAELARGTPATSNTSNPATHSSEELARQLNAAREAGLLRELPPELAATLGLRETAAGEASPEGKLAPIDASALPRSAAELEQLARAALQAMQLDVVRLTTAQTLDPGEVADLAQLLGTQTGQGAKGLSRMPGKGGVDRGRGDAALPYEHNTTGDTANLEARRLPPGRTISREWSVLGMQRVSPQVDPQRDTGSGGSAATGTGDTTWKRRLAPHHRDAVRRFFSQPRDK